MLYLLLLLPLVTSCQYIPDMAKDIESIATDTAIKIELSREALTDKTNIQLNLDVKNKEFESK